MGSWRDVSLGTTKNNVVGCCRDESTGVVKEGTEVNHKSFIKVLWIFICGRKGEEVIGFCREGVHRCYGKGPIGTPEKSMQA